MRFFPKLRNFLRYSHKSKSNQRRSLVLRTLDIIERDEFEGFMRGINQGVRA